MHDPAGVYLHQVLTEGDINIIDARHRQEVPQPQEFLSITTREVQMRRGKAANNISPGSCIRSTCACQHNVHTYFKFGKNLQQRNGGPGSLGHGQTVNAAQHPRAFCKPYHG